MTPRLAENKANTILGDAAAGKYGIAGVCVVRLLTQMILCFPFVDLR